MQGLDSFDGEDSGGTVFRDVIMLALSGFVAIVLLLLPHLNPPTMAEDAMPPGNVIIEIRWPDDLDADVDLWVEAPGDVPVGYSNKDGAVFNLLRDDLGFSRDASDLNYEISYSRGIPAGEYTVNLHLYRNPEGRYPVSVRVAASVKSAADEPIKRIVATEVNLVRDGEEVTAIRFTLDANGELVPGSVNSLPRPLRSKRS